MLIKSSASLRNEYNAIAAMAHQSKEPIFITKNGEGDIVVMSIEAFDEKEKQLALRSKVLEAEYSRIYGENEYSVDDVRSHLREKYKNAKV